METAHAALRYPTERHLNIRGYNQMLNFARGRVVPHMYTSTLEGSFGARRKEKVFKKQRDILV